MKEEFVDALYEMDQSTSSLQKNGKINYTN